MERILKGVDKFRREVYLRHKQLFESLAEQQQPEVLFVTCADSRVNPSLITQTLPGELFVCRNAGNMIPPYGELNGGVSATIDYAVAVLNVRHIVVCGHSNCGAMKGVLHPETVAHLPTVRSWLGLGEVARQVVLDNYAGLPPDQLLQTMAEQNVVAQLSNLRTFPSIASRLRRKAIELHGWMFVIRTGEVFIYDQATEEFEPGGWECRLSADKLERSA